MDSVLKVIDKVFEDTVESDKTLVEVSDFVVDRIQKQTRSGKSLPENRKAIKQVSKEYAKARTTDKFQDENRPLSNLFLGKKLTRKSNLTVTGQLLSSVIGKIVKGIKGKTLIISPTGQRRDGETNEKVAEDLSIRGFNFMGLDDKGIERVKKIVLNNFRRNTKKIFKKP